MTATKTMFHKSQKGQKAYSLPSDSTNACLIQFNPPKALLRQEPLPNVELSELDIMRHFCSLAKKNMGIDTNCYPLGSCTMKFNPRVNELAAALPKFSNTHPLAPNETVQGNLELIAEFISLLCEITGMSAASLTPNAGAQGEFVGVKMIAAYHKARGDNKREQILIPDNAHGTNPASAAMAGFKAVSIRTDAQGDLDLAHLQELACEKTAALMLTNPNTLGLFSPNISHIADIVHDAGGLLYYDGANLNPLLHLVRPGDMGFDVMHLNLHKTFSTPHGGGGPGAGPVLCNERLKNYLPLPQVECIDRKYVVRWRDDASIGQIAAFHGNFAVCLRAYLYTLLHGSYGLRKIAEMAILNANYLKKKVENIFTVPYKQPCMHEFVVQADRFLANGIRAVDIAKRLLDYGFHAPTLYFPLIVKECLLIEPTESESLATLDRLAEAFEAIAYEAEHTPEKVLLAPYSMPCRRVDDVLAARHPKLKIFS
jgi:glycine dehydrogenase subunit 2